MSDKIEIVLDADVIIHFSQGGYLHLLPKVIPDCSFVVLSVVRNELRQETKSEPSAMHGVRKSVGELVTSVELTH